ncbi:MAG: hypothetical protein CL912_09065 [Deltaproteobacteria bacterium]|nr:hypothetical protein [Deltaproteobacteria bacterium]
MARLPIGNSKLMQSTIDKGTNYQLDDSKCSRCTCNVDMKNGHHDLHASLSRGMFPSEQAPRILSWLGEPMRLEAEV